MKLFKFFKVRADDIVKYICAKDINEAAHTGANMLQCCFSDYDWDTTDEKHWYTSSYGNIDVLEVNINLENLIDQYCDGGVIQELLDKKTKEDFSALELQKNKSVHPKEFEEGAKWAIKELSERIEESKAYNWGNIKCIISDMGFKS